MKRTAIVQVSYELLEDILFLPKDIDILAMEFDNMMDVVNVKVSGNRFAEVKEGETPPSYALTFTASELALPPKRDILSLMDVIND